MIDDYEIIELLDLHAICGCVIAEDRHTKGVGPYSCTVSIKNQVVAIDCDKCQAFTQNDSAPRHPLHPMLRSRARLGDN